MILVVTLILGGVGLFTTQKVSSEVTEQRNTELLTSTEQEAEALEEWIGRQRSTTQYLSQDNEIRSSPRAEQSQILQNRISRLTSTAVDIHYVNMSTGEIRSSTDEHVEGSSYEPMSIPWRGEGLTFYGDGDVIMSSVFEYQDRPVIAFASKQSGTDNAVFVFHSVAARGEGFSRNINGSFTEVVDIDGNVQFAAEESSVNAEYRAGSDAPVIAKGLTTNSGIESRGDLLIGHAKIEGTDWVLLKHAPKSNAYTLRRTVQTDIVLLIVAALVGLGTLVLVVGRDALTSLSELSDRAQAIADGDIHAEIQDTGRLDEVGQVRQSFREIQQYLQTVAGQADALAQQDFEADVLEETVPGRLGDSLQTMHRDLERSIDEINEARREAEALATALESQAEEVRDAVEHAADGDLTQRLDTDTDHESMDAIATAFNNLLEEFERTLRRIQAFSEDVAESSDHITTSAREVKRSSAEVSDTVQEMSADAREQNEIVQQASDEMTDLSATIEEIASSSHEVAEQSNGAVSVGETGRERSEKAIEEMEAIDEKATETISEMEALDEEMAQIGEIVTLIDDIAEQTSMLALNASIEAARAGEAGEGFAVVAEEVKSLAKETTEATQEIEDRIGDVQSATSDAVTDMQEMGERLSDGMTTVEATVDTMETIVERIEEANHGVQTINDATDEQATTTEEMVAMVDEVGSISDDTAKRAEEASAVTQEQTASISEVTERIQDLSEQSTDLYDLLTQFQVREIREGADNGDTNARKSVTELPQDDD